MNLHITTYIVKKNKITKNNAFFFIALTSFFPVEVWQLARSTFFGIKYYIFYLKTKEIKINVQYKYVPYPI